MLQAKVEPVVCGSEEPEPALGTELVEEAPEGAQPVPDGPFDLAVQPPEKLEQVVNSGLQFISGLIEMATGQKLATVEEDQRMIQIDKQTGEVTMKFRLPGF